MPRAPALSSTELAARDASSSQSTSTIRSVGAATIGTALESLDLTMYAFMATTLAKLFFPSTDPAVSLLVTFAAYGGTLLMRPLGGIAFGIWADKYGRKNALAVILVLMGVASLMIGLLPNYQSIGIWAPLGLITARLMQGFSIGGEQGSAIAFIAEQGNSRRSEFLSYLGVASGLSQLLAAGMGASLAFFLAPEQVLAWGWRLPFLFGAAICPVGFYIRQHVKETKDFSAMRAAAGAKGNHPLKELLTHHKKALLIAMSFNATGSTALYVGVYMLNFAISHLHLPVTGSMLATAIFGTSMAVAAPFVGRLADRTNRTRLALAATVALIIVPPLVLLWLARAPSLQTLLVAQIIFGLLFAGFQPTSSTIVAEVFPVEVRATGASLATAVAITLFAGFSPFVMLYLASAVKNPVAPSLCLVVMASLTLVAIYGLRGKKI
jgi:MHS family proline/betaine transporter-like MFS transporter